MVGVGELSTNACPPARSLVAVAVGVSEGVNVKVGVKVGIPAALLSVVAVGWEVSVGTTAAGAAGVSVGGGAAVG